MVRLHKDFKKKKTAFVNIWVQIEKEKTVCCRTVFDTEVARHTRIRVTWKNFGPAFGCGVGSLSQEDNVQFEVKTTRDTKLDMKYQIALLWKHGHWPQLASSLLTQCTYIHTDYRPELKQLWKPINHCEPNRFRNHLARSLRCVQSFGQMKNVVNKAASEHIRKARRAGLWSEWGQGRTRDQQMNFDLITKSEPDLVSYRRRRTFTDCEWVSDERESSQLHTADKLADKSLTLQHSLKHIFHV